MALAQPPAVLPGDSTPSPCRIYCRSSQPWEDPAIIYGVDNLGQSRRWVAVAFTGQGQATDPSATGPGHGSRSPLDQYPLTDRTEGDSCGQDTESSSWSRTILVQR